MPARFNGAKFTNELMSHSFDEKAFVKYVRQNLRDHKGKFKIKQFIAICKMCPDTVDDDFKATLSNEMTELLKKTLKPSKNRYNNNKGKEPVELLVAANKFFEKQDREILKSPIINAIDGFYPYARKPLVSLIVSWLDKDEQGDDDHARNLLKKNYRIMDAEAVEKVLDFVHEPDKDKAIQDILSKTPEYMLKRFSEMDLTKKENKKRFLNWIAEKPSYMKKITFDVELKAEDLRLLPSMRRFGFIKELFSPLIHISKYDFKVPSSSSYYRRGSNPNAFDVFLEQAKANPWMNKIKMEFVEEDELKNLVFAASLRKNDDVSKWFDDYRRVCKFRKQLKKKVEVLNNWFALKGED